VKEKIIKDLYDILMNSFKQMTFLYIIYLTNKKELVL